MAGRRLALTVPEVADALGCSTWTVYRAVERGALPVLDEALAGRRVLIPVTALDRAVDGLATFRSDVSDAAPSPAPATGDGAVPAVAGPTTTAGNPAT